MNKWFPEFFLHVFLWVLSFVILHQIFTVEYDGGRSDVVYNLLFHLPLLIIVYVNLFLLRRYRQLALWLLLLNWIVLIALGIGIHRLIFEFIVDQLAVGYYFISYYKVHEIGLFMAVYLIVSTLVSWSAEQFRLQDEKARLEREHQLVKLRNLQAQVNPHFLINSLNNIYAMTKHTDRDTRDYLVKLSDALRYMIYDTNAEDVLLAREIAYIRNYVALEKLRVEHNAQVSLVVRGDFEGFLIAPLLLIPCVENCFKHFAKSKGEILIQIQIRNGLLEMKTRNNFESQKQTEQRGLGLPNVQSRLSMIYPHKHVFKTWREASYFYSLMQIDLA